MMIIWWSKHVGVILSVLVCDIWIDILLQTSALVGPLYIVNWNARWNSERHKWLLSVARLGALCVTFELRCGAPNVTSVEKCSAGNEKCVSFMAPVCTGLCPLAGWLADWLAGWLTDWLTDWQADWPDCTLLFQTDIWRGDVTGNVWSDVGTVWKGSVTVQQGVLLPYVHVTIICNTCFVWVWSLVAQIKGGT
jgi:hypothetical protein